MVCMYAFLIWCVCVLGCHGAVCDNTVNYLYNRYICIDMHGYIYTRIYVYVVLYMWSFMRSVYVCICKWPYIWVYMYVCVLHVWSFMRNVYVCICNRH